MRRILLLASLVLAVIAVPADALAYDEPHGAPEDHVGSVLTNCVPCHRRDTTGAACSSCHFPHGMAGETAGKGPHGVYATTTDRCSACHDAHAAGGPKLLPSATVTGSCYSCHDGTGGRGVYGALAARGVPVGGTHRIDTTSVVPGGDQSSGGPATMAFKGQGGNLGCDDCHSPHDANTVAAYQQERKRTTYMVSGVSTDKLLRRNPGGSVTTVTVYGSDWCLACHKGRSSAGPSHNHPVDSKATTASPFYYEQVALLASDAPTSVTTTGSMAATNRGYLMPYPRTAKQAGHLPICQQCHEDARNVGTLSADGLSADAATFSVTATDGLSATDNPRFQNFPHESANTRLLVETADDLCTNCHPPAGLP